MDLGVASGSWEDEISDGDDPGSGPEPSKRMKGLGKAGAALYIETLGTLVEPSLLSNNYCWALVSV